MRKRTTEMKELELGMDRRDFLKKTAQFAGISLLPNVFGCSSDSASREHDARWWVEGPYAPLTQEATDIPTLIEGSLPNWLNGTYLRNGPNRHANHHFLLGDGVVHAVSFRNGEAQLYQSRFVDTPRLGEGIMRPPSLRDHYSNIGLVFHHGRLMSLGETGLPFELDPSSLATIGAYDFGGAVDTPVTGHPKVDPVTGELVFFGYSFAQPRLTFWTVDQQGEVTQKREVELRAPTLIHDFALTPNYMLIYESPMTFDREMALNGEAVPAKWTPEQGARIGVLNRHDTTKDIVWTEVETGFVFHVVNAFETADGEVVLDLIHYPEMWKNGINDFNPHSMLKRFTLDSSLTVIACAQTSDRIYELPNISSKHVGSDSGHAFMLRYRQPSDGEPLAVNDGLARVNLRTGEEDCFHVGSRYKFEEPYFVQDPTRPVGAGVVLSLVYDLSENTSEMWFFDAESIAPGPFAKLRMPTRIPSGLHGTFIESRI